MFDSDVNQKLNGAQKRKRNKERLDKEKNIFLPALKLDLFIAASGFKPSTITSAYGDWSDDNQPASVYDCDELLQTLIAEDPAAAIAEDSEYSESHTRQSARYNACRSLCCSLDEIMATLQIIARSTNEKPAMRYRASGLLNSLNSLETCFLTLLWKDVLERFNRVRKSLQSVNIKLCVFATSDKLFRTMADLVVSEGYAAVGYEYINIDDCWLEKERNFRGELQPDKQRFPYGLRDLSNFGTALNADIVEMIENKFEFKVRKTMINNMVESLTNYTVKTLTTQNYLCHHKWKRDLRTPSKPSYGVFLAHELYRNTNPHHICPKFPTWRVHPLHTLTARRILLRIDGV
uniref:Uncharacterized protein n=1 Tax=Timema genevievae TaxID=629358 RepID=A0A7R9K785_TIMGE|nr:unnamed protein product [Timema genevievae]